MGFTAIARETETLPDRRAVGLCFARRRGCRHAFLHASLSLFGAAAFVANQRRIDHADLIGREPVESGAFPFGFTQDRLQSRKGGGRSERRRRAQNSNQQQAGEHGEGRMTKT